MKIAVVGAGIFGCTVAIHLARKDHNVVLLERHDSILRGATGANQLRLHEGYHYPRSPSTIAECKAGARLFREQYRKAVCAKGRQFYAIARDERQKTNPMQYERVMGANKLALDRGSLPPFNLNYDLIEAIYEVKECRIKLPVLRNVIWHLLYDWGVDCRFGCNVAIDDDTFSGYDKVILCTYGSESCTKTLKRFELIEKPVVALNTTGEWYNNSLVVMDGPFFSCDPLLGTPYHLLGHVKHCIHGAYDSTMAPDFEESSAADAAMYIDKGCIPAELLGPVSNFDAFQEDIGRFIPDMEFHLGHIGSFFTIRTVLSGVDSTDERPTIVTPIDDKYINVFSGKIGNCIDAAEEVVELCSQ